MAAFVSNLSAYWINPPASIEIKLRNTIAVTMARATLECTWRVAGCLVVERENGRWIEKRREAEGEGRERGRRGRRRGGGREG